MNDTPSIPPLTLTPSYLNSWSFPGVLFTLLSVMSQYTLWEVPTPRITTHTQQRMVAITLKLNVMRGKTNNCTRSKLWAMPNDSPIMLSTGAPSPPSSNVRKLCHWLSMNRNFVWLYVDVVWVVYSTPTVLIRCQFVFSCDQISYEGIFSKLIRGFNAQPLLPEVTARIEYVCPSPTHTTAGTQIPHWQIREDLTENSFWEMTHVACCCGDTPLRSYEPRPRKSFVFFTLRMRLHLAQ